MAYMGGSILYVDSNPRSGQIQDGVSFAIRLGKVSAEKIDEYQVVYNDLKPQEQFGKLTILHASSDTLHFSYNLYYSNGTGTMTGNGQISRDGCYDINGDGIFDLNYKPFTQNRPGLGSASELIFLSDQKTLNTTMYSLIPSEYVDESLPNGLFGINPSGNFIISKYASNARERSISRGILQGDFLLDPDEGTYLRVVKPAMGRALESSDLEPCIDSQESILAILPLVSFEISSETILDGNSILPENDISILGVEEKISLERAVSNSDYLTQLHNMNQEFNNKYKTIFSWSPQINSNESNKIGVTLNNVTLKVGVYGSGNCSWTGFNSNIEAVVYLSGNTFSFNGSGNWSADIIPPQRFLNLETPPIWIGPVLLEFNLSGEAGVKLNVSTSAEAQVNVTASVAGIYGGGVDTSACWGVDWHKVWFLSVPVPYFRTNNSRYGIAKTIYFAGSDGSSSLKWNGATVDLQPYAQIQAGMSLWKIVKARVGPRVAMHNQINFGIEDTKLTGKARIFLQETLNIFAGLEVHVPFLGLQRMTFYDANLLDFTQNIAEWKIF